MSQHELEDEFDRLMREDKPSRLTVMVLNATGKFVPSKPPTLAEQKELARKQIEFWLAVRQSQLDAEQDERAERELIEQLRCMRNQGTITDWQRELLDQYENERFEEWLR